MAIIPFFQQRYDLPCRRVFTPPYTTNRPRLVCISRLHLVRVDPALAAVTPYNYSVLRAIIQAVAHCNYSALTAKRADLPGKRHFLKKTTKRKS